MSKFQSAKKIEKCDQIIEVQEVQEVQEEKKDKKEKRTFKDVWPQGYASARKRKPEEESEGERVEFGNKVSKMVQTDKVEFAAKKDERPYKEKSIEELKEMIFDYLSGVIEASVDREFAIDGETKYVSFTDCDSEIELFPMSILATLFYKKKNECNKKNFKFSTFQFGDGGYGFNFSFLDDFCRITLFRNDMRRQYVAKIKTLGIKPVNFESDLGLMMEELRYKEIQ